MVVLVERARGGYRTGTGTGTGTVIGVEMRGMRMGGDGGEMMMVRGVRAGVAGGKRTTGMRVVVGGGEKMREMRAAVGGGEMTTEIGAAVGGGGRTREGRAVGTRRINGRAGARGTVTMMMTTAMMRIGDGGGAGERMIRGNGGWSVHKLGGDV